MIKDQITFNDLPQIIAELRDEVSGMKALLLNLQNKPTQQRENRHRTVTPEQVAEYTNIPLATIYQKLANREIPGSKPGKRWVSSIRYGHSSWCQSVAVILLRSKVHALPQ